MSIMTFKLARDRAGKDTEAHADGDEGYDAARAFVEANTDINPDDILDGIEIVLTKKGDLTKATEKVIIEAIEAYADGE